MYTVLQRRAISKEKDCEINKEVIKLKNVATIFAGKTVTIAILFSAIQLFV